MKNRFMQIAGVLVLLAVLGKFYAVPLMAQVRAALVKNLDEPGRTPYQSTQSCNTLAGLFCSADLTAVPAGKRLVIQHLSGFVICESINSNCEIQFYYVALTTKGVPFPGPGSDFAYVPMQTSPNSWTAINQDVRLYVEPGAIPEYRMSFNSGPVSAAVTITGYLVDLNQ